MASFLTTSRQFPDRSLHVTIHGVSGVIHAIPQQLRWTIIWTVPQQWPHQPPSKTWLLNILFFPLDEPGLALYSRRHFVAGKELDQ